VHKVETKFFTRNHLPYWTVAIHYGQILSAEQVSVKGGHPDEEFGLDDQQKALMIRLKEWRREVAEQEGFPTYLVATNKALAGAIKNKCTSLEKLKLVKGYGQKRIEKYGKGMVAIIKTFYEGS
jgi:superfamily II DNA helicase RecQ